MATVDTLNLEIKTNSEQAAQGIKNLTKALNGLNRNIADGTKVANLSKQFKNLEVALNGISDSSVARIERLANAMVKLKGANVSLKTATQTLKQANETAMPQAETVTPSPVTDTTTTDNVNAVKDAEQEASKYEKTMKALNKSVKNFAESVKKTIMPVTKFVRALGRVAFYRAVRFLLSSITQGIKEGIKNLAQFSANLNGKDTLNANGVLSKYASEFLYFKNALATGVMPVLYAMLPLVENVINACVDLINIIAQIGSALNGKTTFTKAQFVMTDYASSIDSATGSAKALKKELAGFDELNNLTTNQGGGSGSGANTPNVNDMFTDPVEINSKWLEFANKLKDKFDEILTVAGAIGTTILGWKIGSSIASFISSWLGLPTTKSLGLTLSLGLVFAGIGLEAFGFADKILGGEWTLTNILSVVGGIFATIVGGIVAGLTFIGGLVGGALGGLIGALIVTFVTSFLSMLDIMENGWSWISGILLYVSFALNPLGTLIAGAILLVVKAVTTLIDKMQDANSWVRKIYDAKTNVIKWLGDTIPAISGVCDWIVNLRNNFVNGLSSVSNFIDKIKDLITTFRNLKNEGNFSVSGAISTIKSKIQGYASGGYPGTGELFVARESGAEMVGSIGGRTGVANNEEITEAIAQATYYAMSRALQENGGSITIEGDPNGMFKVIQKQARTYTKSTGNPAFA